MAEQTLIERVSEGLSAGERAARGEEAGRLLDNSTLNTALAMTETEFLEKWLALPGGEGGGEEARHFHSVVHAGGEVKARLRELQTDGVSAEEELPSG